MVAEMARLAPDLPRGLTTGAFDPWPGLAPQARARLAAIEAFDAVGASFVSHEAADLARPRVAALRAAGHPVLCWTIRSPAEEAAARAHADGITFEGYLPARPGDPPPRA
jgi:glycerophosphoryl diester phosphodiesterase